MKRVSSFEMSKKLLEDNDKRRPKLEMREHPSSGRDATSSTKEGQRQVKGKKVKRTKCAENQNEESVAARVRNQAVLKELVEKSVNITVGSRNMLELLCERRSGEGRMMLTYPNSPPLYTRAHPHQSGHLPIILTIIQPS